MPPEPTRILSVASATWEIRTEVAALLALKATGVAALLARALAPWVG